MTVEEIEKERRKQVEIVTEATPLSVDPMVDMKEAKKRGGWKVNMGMKV